MEEAKAEIQARRSRRRQWRAKRSVTFKNNVERFGLARAKFIAFLVTAKQKGTYVYNRKDGRRAKVFGYGSSKGSW